MNSDEERNYTIATNHQNGNGYTLFDPVKNEYVNTSFHNSFTIFIFEFLIKNNINKLSWVLFIFISALLVFLISIYYFYKLSLHFLNDENLAFYSTITYCFYPTTIYFIGSLFLYENLVMPLMIIIIYRLMIACKQRFSSSDYFILPVIIAISCLFRAQVILIYGVLLTIFFLYSIYKKHYCVVPVILITVAITVFAHIPIFLKNKKMFGEYVLSTQSGYEFLQGHNPKARGSWRGDWKSPGNPLYQYSHENIMEIEKLNELEESQARKRLAWNWIRENPAAELKLLGRKLIIFFMPQNYIALPGSSMLNPFNLIIHLLFLAGTLLLIYQRKMGINHWLILSPVLATLALSLIYFVGYRWRYYAEPFMILFAWQLIAMMKPGFLKKSITNSKMSRIE